MAIPRDCNFGRDTYQQLRLRLWMEQKEENTRLLSQINELTTQVTLLTESREFWKRKFREMEDIVRAVRFSQIDELI